MATNSDDKNPPGKDDKWLSSGLVLFARFSSWVIAPVLLGTLIGKWLDKKYDGGQWVFLGVLGISFVISMIGLIHEAGKEFKKISGGEDKKNRDN